MKKENRIEKFATIFIFCQLIKTINGKEINQLNQTLYFYQNLFDSIKGDYYDFESIYNFNYSTIKIIRQPSKNKNSLTCVFGILVNENGLKIEKEILDWLLPEYNVYKIYQKFPGNLSEYPALRFSQWLTENQNISFLLYLHTKGATHKLDYSASLIRYLWKKEFTKPKNQIYISLIINNETDISTPLSNRAITWYNVMFISKRAFMLNKIMPFKNRYLYEYLFLDNGTRIKGVIADKVKFPLKFIINFFKKENQTKMRNKKIHSPNSIKMINYEIILINMTIMIMMLICILIVFLIFHNKIYKKYKRKIKFKIKKVKIIEIK